MAQEHFATDDAGCAGQSMDGSQAHLGCAGIGATARRADGARLEAALLRLFNGF